MNEKAIKAHYNIKKLLDHTESNPSEKILHLTANENILSDCARSFMSLLRVR